MNLRFFSRINAIRFDAVWHHRQVSKCVQISGSSEHKILFQKTNFCTCCSCGLHPSSIFICLCDFKVSVTSHCNFIEIFLLRVTKMGKDSGVRTTLRKRSHNFHSYISSTFLVQQRSGHKFHSTVGRVLYFCIFAFSH